MTGFVKLSLGASLTLFIGVLVAINFAVHSLNLRYDATEEKLYTLSEGTQNIVESLKTPVTLTFYFSRSASKVPLAYKSFGKRVTEVLAEYQRLNPDHLTVHVLDPKPDSDEEAEAEKSGLQGANLGDGSRFYMGIAGTQGKTKLALPLLDPRRESYLEYDLSQLMVQLSGNQLRKIGVLSTLPVLGHQASSMDQLQGRQSTGPWAAFEELQKSYHLASLNPELPFPADLDLLVVVHPRGFGDQTLYRIDQFVLSGKPVMILADPFARVDPITQMMNQGGRRSAMGSDLKPLFNRWGVLYSPGDVLGDLKRAVQVNSSQGLTPFALWQHLGESALNPEVVATKGLENLLFVEPGAFRMAENSPLKLTSLLKSSNQAATVPVELLAYSGPEEINRKVKPDQLPHHLAGLLTGELDTAFAVVPEGTPATEPSSQLKHSAQPAKILLITDVDFIHDQFAVDRFSLLGQVVSQPKNDNLGFFVNMVDFLGGSTDLMGIRSRGTFSRPFKRFEEMGAQAAVTYRAEQTKLNQKLKDVQAKLAALTPKDNTKQGLTAEQVKQLELFQADELEAKQRLRKIRKLLNQDIESAKTWITLVNLLLMPLLVMLAGLFIYRKRFRSE